MKCARGGNEQGCYAKVFCEFLPRRCFSFLWGPLLNFNASIVSLRSMHTCSEGGGLHHRRLSIASVIDKSEGAKNEGSGEFKLRKHFCSDWNKVGGGGR